MTGRIDELGREVGLSRSALHERFVQLIGAPPMQYLAQWRMQAAARLLLETRGHRRRDRARRRLRLGGSVRARLQARRRQAAGRLAARARRPLRGRKRRHRLTVGRGYFIVFSDFMIADTSLSQTAPTVSSRLPWVILSGLTVARAVDCLVCFRRANSFVPPPS